MRRVVNFSTRAFCDTGPNSQSTLESTGFMIIHDMKRLYACFPFLLGARGAYPYEIYLRMQNEPSKFVVPQTLASGNDGVGWESNMLWMRDYIAFSTICKRPSSLSPMCQVSAFIRRGQRRRRFGRWGWRRHLLLPPHHGLYFLEAFKEFASSRCSTAPCPLHSTTISTAATTTATATPSPAFPLRSLLCRGRR